MVGIPKAFSRSRTQPPIERSFQAGGAAQTLQLAFGVQTVDTASGANRAVPFQHLLTKIAGVGAQTPFLHAPSRTKRHTSLGNFQAAPAAQMAAVGTLGKALTVGPAAGHISLRAHRS